MNTARILTMMVACLLFGISSVSYAASSATHTKPTMQDLAENPAISDNYIQRTVQSKLKNDKTLNGVKVTTRDGVVTLNGSVDTEEEATNAVRVARSISGVKEVENDLKIKEIKKENNDANNHDNNNN